jgi:RecG-like helicase
MDTAHHHKQLITAASEGDVQKVQELLPVAYAQYKNKALVQAAKNGHTMCVKMLLTECKNEKENQRALLQAFRNGHTQCVELLLHYYPGLEEDHGLLMDAAAKGQFDMVRVLAQASQQKTINEALMDGGSNRGTL